MVDGGKRGQREALDEYRDALSSLVDGTGIDGPEAIVELTGMPLEDAERVWAAARRALSEAVGRRGGT